MQAGKPQPYSLPDEAAQQHWHVVPTSELAVCTAATRMYMLVAMYKPVNTIYLQLRMQEGLFLTMHLKAGKNVHAAKNPRDIVPGKASGCQKCTVLQQNMLQWQAVRMLSLASHNNAGKEHACCYWP